MENMKGNSNRLVSIDDIERFISNFICQKCQSLGSYIVTKELFQWMDQSLNITFKCQNCSMSLSLTESSIIEVCTPGCTSKNVSLHMLQLARAAAEIGLSYSQIETLLQSLGIPSPTLSIWKTYLEIASERNKSSISEPTYVKQTNEVEQIRIEDQFHNLIPVKIEIPDESNTIIKEEPPDMDIKEELVNKTNDELFMEYNDEVIVPDVIHSGASKSINQQTAKEGTSNVVDADCMEVYSIDNRNTIYIEERTSGNSTSPIDISEDEIIYDGNINEVKKKKIMKKRHIVTPKRYRDDFYCEDYRNKSSIRSGNKITSNNAYVAKNNQMIDKCLVYDSNADKKDKKNENTFKTDKQMENDFYSESVNNEKSTSNVEMIEKSNIGRIEIICALCGSCKYSNNKHYYFSLIPGFGSITVKVALQILNLQAKKPNCKHFCTPCFNNICSKFKYTLKKKIAEQKNIDISEVMLSKIKVRMFDRLDKKIDKPETASYSNETAISTSSITTQSQKVVELNSVAGSAAIFHSNEKALSTSSITTQSQKVVKLNSNNEVRYKRKKYLTKKMSESLSQKRVKIPYLTKQLETDAILSHPMVQLIDVSLILPSEVFHGASVSVNRKSDILQFCKRKSL